ncbi:LANO_0H20890g1_1 [Lachancea nothofagi CBS 11611]|uniref:LANO_0H20890g1_1 n=1 Tax=Lachancea nothofagi CBS 11611 TaxID=1266666 RepID=A0A1G4KNB4_9SACH|nr:LANO_0H20890g1_1 [Lachancea nothofagi CBS 11611]
MEKFTNWRDKGTGIAPFLPTPPYLAQEKGFQAVLSVSKFVLKTICALPVIILALASSWAPGRVSKTLWGVVAKIVCNWNLQVAIQGVKRRDKQSKLPAVNEVYVVNCSSPLDCVVLWFLAQGPAAFCIPSVRGKTVRFFHLTIWQFVKFTLNNGELPVLASLAEVDNIAQLKNRVVYLFAEGTTSNGKSILPFTVSQESWDAFLGNKPETGISTSSNAGSRHSNLSKVKCQAIHLKINSSLTTPLRVSKWRFLVRVSTQGVNCKCKISEPIDSDLIKIRKTMCGGDKFKLVGKELTIDSKRSFVKEFGHRRR